MVQRVLGETIWLKHMGVAFAMRAKVLSDGGYSPFS